MWTGTEFEIDICFIRHGRTKSNDEHRYLSYTDEPLSIGGKTEICSLKESYPSVGKIFTSTKIRTVETAELIYGKTDITQIKEFDELNFGNFEGKTYDELKNDCDYSAWLNSGCTSKIPNGESRDEFIKRQLSGLDSCLLMTKKEKNIAVVAHGGTVMSIFSSFADGDYYDYMIKNGGFISCHIKYYITGSENVHVSHFSITGRNDP